MGIKDGQEFGVFTELGGLAWQTCNHADECWLGPCVQNMGCGCAEWHGVGALASKLDCRRIERFADGDASLRASGTEQSN